MRAFTFGHQAPIAEIAADGLNLDFRAKRDHAVWRYAEEFRRGHRIAVHHFKHPTPECAHAGVRGGHNYCPPHEKRRIHHFKVELLRPAFAKCLWNVRLLYEAITRDDTVEIVAEMRDLDMPFRCDTGNILGHHTQQYNSLVQHLVVFEIVQERHRHNVKTAGHVHGGARHARLGVHPTDEIG